MSALDIRSNHLTIEFGVGQICFLLGRRRRIVDVVIISVMLMTHCVCLLVIVI